LNLEYKTLLVVDTGQAVEFAVRLAREYGRVMYWSPAADPFPVASKQVIGDLDNVERVEEVYEGIKDADIIAFPAIGFASMIVALREQGKRVWGNAYGEYLEQDRVAFKHWLEKHKLPCVPYEVITGLDNLVTQLKSREDVFIKLPQWLRGDSETYHWRNAALSVAWAAALRHSLGPLAAKVPFVVEERLDGFETGTDRFTIDGKFPKHGLMGHEVKDRAYVGKVMDKYPDVVVEPDEFLADWFRQTQYRNFYSTETRVTKDGKEYFIDLAARLPSPPGAVELEAISNLGDVVWAGAGGELEEPKWSHPYVAELKLECQWAETHWTPLNFPKKYRNYIKLQNACQQDGLYWLAPLHVPILQRVSAVGLGDTAKTAIDQAIEAAKSIKAGGENDFTFSESTLTDAQEAIDEAEKYGIKW
jgi:hypothetical protein